jgi:hypothetical protein
VHDLDVFADQRTNLEVFGLEPIEAIGIDRHRHHMDDAKQRNKLRNGCSHARYGDQDGNDDNRYRRD